MTRHMRTRCVQLHTEEPRDPDRFRNGKNLRQLLYHLTPAQAQQQRRFLQIIPVGREKAAIRSVADGIGGASRPIPRAIPLLKDPLMVIPERY